MDNTNGAYSLAFRLELCGGWGLTPRVNGNDIPAAAVKARGTEIKTEKQAKKTKSVSYVHAIRWLVPR